MNFAVGVAINTFFITNTLIDVSVFEHAVTNAGNSSEAASQTRLAFLLHFLEWRGSAPYISTLLLVLAAGLIFVVFDGTRGCLQTVCKWRSATRTRHVADLWHFATLFFVLLPTVVGWVIPLTQQLQLACTDAPSISYCEQLARQLLWYHKVLLLLNALMLLWDVLKFLGNAAA